MRTKVCFLLGACFFTGSFKPSWQQAKPSILTIIYVEGEIAYRPSAEIAWKPLNIKGREILASSSYDVKLTNESILVVKNNDQPPIVIRNRTGVFTLSALLHVPTDEVATILGDYFRNLWRNLAHHQETLNAYAQAHMKRKGLASRGDGCTTPLMVTPDFGAALPSDTAIIFVWKRDSSALGYTLAIHTNFGEQATTLYSTETTDTTLRFALDKPFIEKEVIYYWSVVPKGKPNCVRYTFTLPKTETFRRLEARIAAIQQQNQADAALNTFVKAALYESNNYYPEAYRFYFQAYRLSPGNTLYRNGFALFLARRGLTQEANALMAGK